MKICFVTPEFVSEESCFDGGLSNYLLRVSLGLVELGHKPIIVVSSIKNEIISHENIEVHRVKIKKLTGSSALNWLYQSYILNNYLKTIAIALKIDLVQYSSYTGFGLFRLQFLPAVVRVSSYNPLITHFYDISEVSQQINNDIEINGVKRADAVFGPSKLIAGEISRNAGVSVKVIESPFIFNYTKLDFSACDKLSGKKYLLFFGSLGLLKGVKTIAEILQPLFSNHPDLYFVFIGKDLGFNGQKMIDFVYENAGIYRNRIFYFDKMNQGKLYPFIIRSLAVVIPSRIDNFPNACIEAMAHGKVVIGTKNTGFEQLIEHGINGFLCERDNKQQLLEIIEIILNLSPSEIDLIQKKATQRIEFLKPKFVVENLVSFYSEVIKNFRSNINERNDFEIDLLWHSIEDYENKLALKDDIIHQNDEVIKNILDSNSYKIGKFFIQPLNYLKNKLK